jgi:hypothetical protein
MRIRMLCAVLAIVLVAPTLDAQGKPATSTTATSKGKSLIGKIADTAITSAASMATDTLLGENAGMVAAALGADGAPSCPAGLMPIQSQYAMGAGAGMTGMPSAGSMIVGAAKSKLGGKAAAATGVAGAVAGNAAQSQAAAAQAQYMCGTPDQISAAVQAAQAQQSQGGMAAAAAAQTAGIAGAMKYTPMGAAIAAAPMAGKAAKKLGGMFGKGGQSAESMKKDLGKGRLVVQKLKFQEGSDELAPGFEEELTKLTEAFAGTEGSFVLRVPAEAGEDAAAAAALAEHRQARVYAHLLLNGIPAARLAREDVATGKPVKKGDVRVELVAGGEASTP